MMASLKKTWKKLGPGLITGSSDDDPSGIATYTQAGAKFGLETLWTAFLTYPLMYGIQEMCARIGIVTSLGLAGVIKKYYSPIFLYLLLIIIFPAVTFNIAADLTGMGAVAHLFFPQLSIFVYSCLFSLALISALFFFSYQKLSYVLKWLCLSLFAYLIVPFLVKQNWYDIAWATFLPYIRWDKEFITILVAILGTTISPYLFFWQANMAVEEVHHKYNQGDKKEIENMKSDVNAGMFFSNLIMFFIILTAGSVLFPAGITQVETVKDAAEALQPLAGKFAYVLFALGVIGTGLLAIPVLTGCLGYLFAEAFDWPKGLDKNPKEAPGFYAVMLASMASALLLNILEINAIQFLIYSAILYGIIAPFLIAIILHIANSKNIMGNFVNKWLSNLVGIAAFILMAFAAIALLLF